ncbi:MAG: hypothetical protein ACRDY5_06235 [Acidimicrobiales bacterium]
MDPMAQMRPAGGGPTVMAMPRKLGDVLIDEFFEYIATVTFTASQNQILNIPIQADAHFLCVSSYMNSNAATGAGTFAGACVNRGGSLVQLTDGGTQRALSSAQVPANTLFGSAQRPFIWPFRKIFRANTSITLNVTDTTAGAQVVDYVFGGFKIPIGSAPEFRL